MELDETNFDVIVLGTGFAESVIAGALARSGKRVLHLDQNDFYGGYMCSYNLSTLDKALRADSTPKPANDTIEPPNEQVTTVPVSKNVGPIFHNVKIYQTEAPSTPVEPTTTEVESVAAVVQEAPTESVTTSTDEATTEPQTTDSQAPIPENVEEEEPEEEVTTTEEIVSFEALLEEARHYSIDLVPRLLLARGPMINLLISSSVGRYLEFKCYEKSYLYTSNSLQPVPCSKSDIFKSKFITNSERRMLGRFLQLIQEDMEQPGKIDREQYPTLYDFVKAQNLTPKLEEFILYTISLVGTNQEDPAYRVNSTFGLKNLQSYIASVDKYGPTPYLYSMYGCSEIPQAFCRLAAVYGGIYVLRRSAKCLLLDAETKEFKGVICTEGQTLNAKHFVTSAEYLPQLVDGSATKVQKSSRCVVVTNKPLTGEGVSEGMSFIVLPPNAVGNKHPIHVLQFDYRLYATPKRKYVLHFVTETTATAEEDLSAAVNLLLHVPGAQSDQAESSSNPNKKPSALWRAYFELWANVLPSHTFPSFSPNVYLVNVGSLETAVDMGYLLEEAKKVFGEVIPGEEFLPKVPNPEDIIWSDEAAESSQTTGG